MSVRLLRESLLRLCVSGLYGHSPACSLTTDKSSAWRPVPIRAIHKQTRAATRLTFRGQRSFPASSKSDFRTSISVDRNELEAKLDLNGRVLHAYPEADVAYRQSALLALSGELAAAYRLWDLAVAVYPGEAAKAAKTLAQQSSAGEARLTPLVEYAASRTKEQ